MRATQAALVLGLFSAPALASAQGGVRFPAADARVAEPHRTDELVTLMVLTSTYGLRLGSSINLLAGRRPDDGAPETFWILPGALALALPAAAWAIDRRWPLRRGRILTAGSTLLLGYIGSIAASAYARGEVFPSSESIAGLPSFYGSTAGLALGVLVGHLTDATPGDAMYIAAGGVGGALFGAFACGGTRCGADFGLWTLVGQATGLGLSLATRHAVRPTGAEMRMLTLGAVAGLLPAGAVMLAHGIRDGEISAEAVTRISWAGLGGVVVGALSFYALARANPPPPTASTEPPRRATIFTPTLELRPGGAMIGLRIDEG